MRFASILNGVVVNAILADHGFDPGDGSTLVQSDTAQIGDTFDGVHFTPAPPLPPVVPASVAMWQAKAALQAAGLLTSATAAVAAASNPVLTAFWEGASTIDRSSPTLAGIAAALSLTSEQIDALFIQAASISL